MASLIFATTTLVKLSDPPLLVLLLGCDPGAVLNALNWPMFVCSSYWLEHRLEQLGVKLFQRSIWLQPRTWTPFGLLGQAFML